MALSVRFLLIWYGLFLVFAWHPGTVAFGAGTDVVRLANGDVLRGQIVRQDADGELLIAIRRAWLTEAFPQQEMIDVESVFEVPLPDHGWVTVWRDQLQVDATTPRPAYEEQITADQQVGRALEALKNLGVFSNANLTKAIRFGAATVEAQQNIDRRFDAFNSTYTQRLDGPPLVW